MPAWLWYPQLLIHSFSLYGQMNAGAYLLSSMTIDSIGSHCCLWSSTRDASKGLLASEPSIKHSYSVTGNLHGKPPETPTPLHPQSLRCPSRILGQCLAHMWIVGFYSSRHRLCNRGKRWLYATRCFNFHLLTTSRRYGACIPSRT